MSFKFNREIFFAEFRKFYGKLRPGKSLSTLQIAGLEFLLTQIENDSIWQSIGDISYALGTTGHETAWTFQPINEIGSLAYFERRYGYQTPVGKRLGNDSPGEGAKYHGRGDVQLTGETNYERLELDLRKHYPHLIAEFEARTGQRFDLSEFPEQAKEPLFAYAIMAFGMYNGRFTGKSFEDFTDGNGKLNMVKARAIINGNDKAQHIANVSKCFVVMLSRALVTEVVAAPVASANEAPPAQSLSTPVAIEKVEPHDTGATTAYEAIKGYGMAAAKALGITSVGGAIATVTGKLTGINIPPEYITYILIGFVALIFLVVLFGGLALVAYVAGRFVLTAMREHQATKINLMQMQSVSRPEWQAVSLVAGGVR